MLKRLSIDITDTIILSRVTRTSVTFDDSIVTYNGSSLRYIIDNDPRWNPFLITTPNSVVVIEIDRRISYWLKTDDNLDIVECHLLRDVIEIFKKVESNYPCYEIYEEYHLNINGERIRGHIDYDYNNNHEVHVIVYTEDDRYDSRESEDVPHNVRLAIDEMKRILKI